MYLFLFGGFQNHIVCNNFFTLPHDAVIFDIGANIGSITLQLAQRVPLGHIYSFEPTDYVFKRLQCNISLNPKYAKNITAIQGFISDNSQDASSFNIYSSWKIDGKGTNTHPIHGGTTHIASNVPLLLLIIFVKIKALKRWT